jgi:hypothetical protein
MEVRGMTNAQKFFVATAIGLVAGRLDVKLGDQELNDFFANERSVRIRRTYASACHAEGS